MSDYMKIWLIMRDVLEAKHPINVNTAIYLTLPTLEEINCDNNDKRI